MRNNDDQGAYVLEEISWVNKSEGTRLRGQLVSVKQLCQRREVGNRSERIYRRKKKYKLRHKNQTPWWQQTENSDCWTECKPGSAELESGGFQRKKDVQKKKSLWGEKELPSGKCVTSQSILALKTEQRWLDLTVWVRKEISSSCPWRAVRILFYFVIIVKVQVMAGSHIVSACSLLNDKTTL